MLCVYDEIKLTNNNNLRHWKIYNLKFTHYDYVYEYMKDNITGINSRKAFVQVITSISFVPEFE